MKFEKHTGKLPFSIKILGKFDDQPFLTSERHPLSLVIQDNFFRDPDKIREIALSMEFAKVTYSGFPGVRTGFFYCEHLHQKLNQLLKWENSTVDFMAFSCTMESTPREIHFDIKPDDDLYDVYAGIVYLSKPLEKREGTAFWKHTQTGYHGIPPKRKTSFSEFIQHSLSCDLEKQSEWEKTLSVEYFFNRLLLYPANLFHQIGPGWRETVKEARLVLTMQLRTLKKL